MRQPIKFLPYLKTAAWGGEAISRFKGLKINCKDIGESWELSGVPGCESIVMDGDDCGMTLADMVSKYKDRLVGESVYNRYGDTFPLVVKFINAADELSVQMSSCSSSDGCRYCPATGSMSTGIIDPSDPGIIGPSASGFTDPLLTTDYTDASGALSKAKSSEPLTTEEPLATEELLKSDSLHIRKEVVAGERHLTNSHDSFMGLVCVGGNGSLKVDGISTSVRQGETLLLPAHTDEFDVEGTLALLTIVIPTMMACE